MFLWYTFNQGQMCTKIYSSLDVYTVFSSVKDICCFGILLTRVRCVQVIYSSLDVYTVFRVLLRTYVALVYFYPGLDVYKNIQFLGCVYCIQSSVKNICCFGILLTRFRCVQEYIVLGYCILFRFFFFNPIEFAL